MWLLMIRTGTVAEALYKKLCRHVYNCSTPVERASACKECRIRIYHRGTSFFDFEFGSGVNTKLLELS